MSVKFTFNSRHFNINSELLKKVSEKKKIDTLDAVGSFVASEAKDRAPIDEGFLTADIETQTYPKESLTVIRVPINSPSSGYAIKMHDGIYNLGPKSAAKQARQVKRVGPQYIIRGINEEKPLIREIIIKGMAL